MPRALALATFVATLGAACAVGERGAMGSTGEQGPPGDPGERGAEGARGPQGEPGTMGTRGPAGPKGNTGANGERGPSGASGPRGPKGDKGNPGLPATPIVLASEGPGTNCDEGGIAVSVGATTEYVCNGADGAQGMTGDKGDTGDPGQPGVDGIGCWDLNADGDCDDLAGAMGDEDANGDDVCDALDCQGPKGDTGDQGVKGDKGDQGNTGPTGPAGAWTVLDANGTTLGRMLGFPFVEPADDQYRFVTVWTADGVFLSYHMATGEVWGYPARGGEPLNFGTPDCTGQPYASLLSGPPRIVDGAVLSEAGDLYRAALPKAARPILSFLDAGGICQPLAEIRDTMPLELIGPEPPAAPMPFQFVAAP